MDALRKAMQFFAWLFLNIESLCLKRYLYKKDTAGVGHE
ncbi:Uncharacterized protein LMKH_0070a [Listeria monocytogenes]|nr:hypothetical protein X845_2925 [Listeria monocytogenes Lm_1824]QRF63613.1 Uncharacterized protein LMKH_0070a [Listeria monocytogenes]